MQLSCAVFLDTFNPCFQMTWLLQNLSNFSIASYELVLFWSKEWTISRSYLGDIFNVFTDQMRVEVLFTSMMQAHWIVNFLETHWFNILTIDTVHLNWINTANISLDFIYSNSNFIRVLVRLFYENNLNQLELRLQKISRRAPHVRQINQSQIRFCPRKVKGFQCEKVRCSKYTKIIVVDECLFKSNMLDLFVIVPGTWEISFSQNELPFSINLLPKHVNFTTIRCLFRTGGHSKTNAACMCQIICCSFRDF